MKLENVSVESIMADVRRQMIDGADQDRKFARDVRKDEFDASIAKKIEVAGYEHAAAVNDYEISNVEGMSAMIPFGIGEVPKFLITMGAERRQEYASDLPVVGGVAPGLVGGAEGLAGTIGDGFMGPDNSFSNTLEHADRGAKIANNDAATLGKIDAEQHGDAASRAKELLEDARERRKQAMADAKSVNDDRREALRLANQI
ncbi:MAG: hypothetical protein RL846_20685 [Deltaproteobacteria bacterium]